MGKRSVHINTFPISKTDYEEILAAKNPSSTIFMIYSSNILLYYDIFYAWCCMSV